MSAASSVRADVLATATRTNLITGGGTQVVALPLTNNDRSTRLVFSTTVAQQKVVITYNAECQVKGGGFVVVTVNVDGTEADPASGTNFALCTSAPGNASQPVGAVRQSVFIVGTPGTHSVEVDAVLSVASGGWQLDDTSLVVEK